VGKIPQPAQSSDCGIAMVGNIATLFFQFAPSVPELSEVIAVQKNHHSGRFSRFAETLIRNLRNSLESIEK